MRMSGYWNCTRKERAEYLCSLTRDKSLLTKILQRYMAVTPLCDRAEFALNDEHSLLVFSGWESYKGCASAYLLFHRVAKPDLHPQQWKESHISILPLIPTSSNPLNRQTLPPCHLPVLHWRTTCKTTELNECLSKLLSIYTDCPTVN